MIELLRPFIISFAIGLIIGLEREHSLPEGKHAIGVRTFILFALLGTLTANINQDFITIAIAIFVFGAILLGYYRSTDVRRRRPGIGLTTEIAAAIVFCLGYITVKSTLVAIIIGMSVLLILVGRNRLHQLARRQIRQEEIRAAIEILLISLLVLVFLPDHTIDPWNLFNPRRLGILIIILSVMQFSGYVAMRIFGERLGVVLMGFFGGLASSTAVFATLPRFYREHVDLLRPIVAAAIYSVVAMLLELFVIVFVASSEVAITLLWPLIAMIAVGILIAFLLVHTKQKPEHGIIAVTMNPLDIKAILRLTAFLGGMLFLVALSGRYFGNEGIRWVSFLGGLFELHSISLATATMFSEHKLTLMDARYNLGIAVLATFFSKYLLLWGLARNRFAVLTSLVLMVILIAGIVVFFLT